ncbi:MAG: PIN domain-containing protein [Burkholderiaceae bacterium]|nr:PIN domain-containing protein [Burkholderiaceae bacterium]
MRNGGTSSRVALVPVSTGSVLAVAELARKHRLQWWDALILEAALRAKAGVLVTGDGQYGQRFGSLVIENPFYGVV